MQALFDEASETFDEKLTRLEYAVPRGLGLAIAEHVRVGRGGLRFATALDAGCGTGRLGSYLRPLVSGTLSGSDLSPKMLAIAAELRRTADEYCRRLAIKMTEDGQSKVLYRLRPGTVVFGDADEWLAFFSGAAHTKEYVEMAARAGGYELVQYEQQSPRTEYGKPLPGHLFVFAR